MLSFSVLFGSKAFVEDVLTYLFVLMRPLPVLSPNPDWWRLGSSWLELCAPAGCHVKAFNCSLYTQVIVVLIWRALLKLLCPFRLTRSKRSNTGQPGGTGFLLSLGILVRRHGTRSAIAMFIVCVACMLIILLLQVFNGTPLKS